MLPPTLTLEQFGQFLKDNFVGDWWEKISFPYSVGEVVAYCEDCQEHKLTERTASLLNQWLTVLKDNGCPSPGAASLHCGDDDLSLTWYQDGTPEDYHVYLSNCQRFGTDVMLSGKTYKTTFHKIA